MIHASGRSLGRGFKQPFGCLTDTNLFPATEVEHAQLEAVYIYFDTATYDEIERDVKVTRVSSVPRYSIGMWTVSV